MRTYTKIIRNYGVPVSSYTLYKEGEHCANAEPGDIILVTHRSIVSLAIRFGQRFHYWRKRMLGHPGYLQEFCRFNHAAVIVEGGEDAQLIEMASKGGQQVSLATYEAKEYAIVKMKGNKAQKQGSVDFANYCLDIEYGYLSILAIIINILIGWGISFSSRGLICSAATSLSTRCLGLIPDSPDVTVMPADLARYFGVYKDDA